MKKRYIFYLFFILSVAVYSQDDIQIGSNLKDYRQSQGALYDYSDPEAINIKVLVWGFVKYPGQYIIPASSNVNDLISLSGGPTDDADLDDLRLFRINKDSSQSMIKFNYDDLLWNEELTRKLDIPTIQAGDILLVPGSPRFYAKDYFSLGLAIVSTLASIATLLITIINK